MCVYLYKMKLHYPEHEKKMMIIKKIEVKTMK